MRAFSSKRSFWPPVAQDYSALASFLTGTGIVNVNVEPTPIWLFTQVLPPWSSTNFRHELQVP
jgi:hypothetical protein